MIKPWLLVCLISGLLGVESSHAVQTLSNPLMKPVNPLAGGGDKASAEDKSKYTSGGRPGEASGAESPESRQSAEETKRQAERRLTQEDLNIRQQQLNSPVVPLYLQNLFEQMSVVGYFKGAVVLRRQSTKISSSSSDEPRPAAASSSTSGAGSNANTSGNGSGSSGSPAPTTPAGAVRDAVISGPSLRLQVGRVTNLNGYRVRAVLMGQDVSVDWQDDNGRWGNVFVGILQSTSGLNPVPRSGQLESLQTSQFNYLKPQIGGASLSGGGGSGGLGVGGGAGAGLGGFGSTNGNSPFGQTGGGFGAQPGNGFR